jgi:mannose-6-phosphate isomerase
MSNSADIYPLLIAPKTVPAIWGGNALTLKFGKPGDAHEKLGESWECWDDNTIANGVYAGLKLAELRKQLGSALMGTLDQDTIFPILTKIIDAQLALSVQVHPDDGYARKHEHQVNGKTECWHILSADEGAELILGWSRDTDKQEYMERVGNGTLGEILRRVPVEKGDSFYLPAGTLHAIGAGIQVFETQQASDLTYRIFDWNRVDANGQPRKLHVDKAADVLDYNATFPKAAQSLVLDEAECKRVLLIADFRFLVERIDFSAHGMLAGETDNRPVVVMALGKPLQIEAGSTIQLDAFETAIVPAAAGKFTLASAGGGALIARPSPDLERAKTDALRLGASKQAISAFFEQFQTRE